MTQRICSCIIALVSFGYAFSQTPNVKLLNLRCNWIVYDSVHGQAILAMPAQGDVTYPRVAFMNPALAEIDSEIMMQEEPEVLALSADGSRLYVGTSTHIFRYELPSMNLLGQIDLGSILEVADLEVFPHEKESVCALIYVSNQHPAIRIYDGNTLRPVTTEKASTNIAFAGSDTLLYGFHDYSNAWNLETYAIRPDGLHLLDSRSGLINGFDQRIEYAKGSIWSDDGYNVDVSGPVPLKAGRCVLTAALDAAISPAWDEDIVYIYQGNILQGHDAFTFNPTFASYKLDYSIEPRDMITWGNGLKLIVRGEDQLLIINDCTYSGDPIAPLIQKVTGCLGDTVKLTATRSSDTYYWNTGETSNEIFVEGKTTAVFNYRIPDAAGCLSPVAEEFVVDLEDFTKLPGISSTKTYACTGEEFSMSATYSGNVAQFVWSTGDTSSAILANGPGLYSVYAISTRGCVSPARSRMIEAIGHSAPAKPILSVDGELDFCPQQPPLVTGPSGLETYLWTPFFPIHSDTARITTSIDLSLRVVDGDGCNSVSSDTLAFRRRDADPGPITIQLNNALLASSIQSGNQWFKDNIEIPGAVSQFYPVVAPGLYQARAYQLGCFIGASNVIPYMTSSVKALEQHSFRIFPNPGSTEVRIESEMPFDRITVSNTTGEKVLTYSFGTTRATSIDISKIPSGLYVLVATHGSDLVFRTKSLKI